MKEGAAAVANGAKSERVYKETKEAPLLFPRRSFALCINWLIAYHVLLPWPLLGRIGGVPLHKVRWWGTLCTHNLLLAALCLARDATNLPSQTNNNLQTHPSTPQKSPTTLNQIANSHKYGTGKLGASKAG